ncbi:hypothetical protein AB0K43_14390 [Kitasatospora sp. NPDC049258]|uniref:hypothetical protein n=1 Tax=Kitasatospora sp. NPDC049258 TaxID=3155394 RepID=UPI003445C9F1
MSEPMLDAVLRLYPKAYRADRGAELAEVYASLAGDTGRLGRARELLGLAGHGLRLRAGLTSAGTPGRLLAAALPFVLGAGFGRQAAQLWRAWSYEFVRADGYGWWGSGLLALWAVALAAVLCGRWGAARWAGAAALLAGVAVAGALIVADSPAGPVPLLAHALDLVAYGVTPGAWLLLVLLAPADLLGGRVRQAAASVLAGAVVAALVTVGPSTFGTPLFWDSSWYPYRIVLAALPLLALARGRLRAAAPALAVLPLVVGDAFWPILIDAGGPWRLLAFTGFLAVALLLAAVFRHRSPLPGRQRPPAAG